MRFGKFILGGAEYPLEHLDNFDVIVAAKNPLQAPATIRVTFGHHVFSEKWDDAVHTADHEYQADGERRAFCAVRYGCSIELSAIIKYHIEGKAYYSRDGNGVLNTIFYAEADNIPYMVIFNLRRADRIPGIDGILHVVSAYQNPAMPSRSKLQSIKFAMLVHKSCPPKTKK
jgi:hypothetical protein